LVYIARPSKKLESGSIGLDMIQRRNIRSEEIIGECVQVVQYHILEDFEIF
jgi:hypothetical protein